MNLKEFHKRTFDVVSFFSVLIQYDYYDYVIDETSHGKNVFYFNIFPICMDKISLLGIGIEKKKAGNSKGVKKEGSGNSKGG